MEDFCLMYLGDGREEADICITVNGKGLTARPVGGGQPKRKMVMTMMSQFTEGAIQIAN